jgi:predicted DNA-binding transcriptional regulator AlpA
MGKNMRNGELSPVASVASDRSELKARQSARIKEIGEALIAEGISALDQQAKVLGLSRSTTWTIVKGNHKNSGLSAAIIERMLSAPQLPPRVRLKIFQYANEKRAGHFGDSQVRLRKFQARLAALLQDMPRFGVQQSAVRQIRQAPERRAMHGLGASRRAANE